MCTQLNRIEKKVDLMVKRDTQTHKEYEAMRKKLKKR